MSAPKLYFRIKENGAAVFRVIPEPRQGRNTLEPLAVLNLRSGEVKIQGGRQISQAEEAQIARWIKRRRALLEARGEEEATQLIEHLNGVAQWAHSQADDAQLEALTEDILMAMQDLREVLIRAKANRIKDAHVQASAKQQTKNAP
jgi:hypothetical protein